MTRLAFADRPGSVRKVSGTKFDPLGEYCPRVELVLKKSYGPFEFSKNPSAISLVKAENFFDLGKIRKIGQKSKKWAKMAG